jgi:beta-glucosidase
LSPWGWWVNQIVVDSGTTERVSIQVPKDDLGYYDMDQQQWVLESRTYRILVGPHSGEEVLLEVEIQL